jgi:hypothetical protein
MNSTSVLLGKVSFSFFLPKIRIPLLSLLEIKKAEQK